MFDPTVYENLKVVLEGEIYDLDLDGPLQITNRKDQIDLANLSRTYRLQFKAKKHHHIVAEIELYADLHAFTDELIHSKENVGCDLLIYLYIELDDLKLCEEITEVLNHVWDNRPVIKQKITFQYPNEANIFQNEIMISFDRKITEAQIEDIPFLVEYTLKSMEELNKIK